MAKKMTPEQALEWLVGQTILGIEVANDCIVLAFKEGYVAIDYEEIAICTENPK